MNNIYPNLNDNEKPTTYVPANLKAKNLDDQDIRNYYSLQPVDEYDGNHKKRMSKHIDEFFKFQSGVTKTTPEAKKQKKKRLTAAVRDKPKNSKVFIAFDFWRKQQIDKHIIIQMKDRTVETSESDDKKYIQELLNLMKEKDTEILKLNNKIRKMEANNRKQRALGKTEKPAHNFTCNLEEPHKLICNLEEPHKLICNLEEPVVDREIKVKEPVVEPVKEPVDPENPYDNTSESEALEIHEKRITCKLEEYLELREADPTLLAKDLYQYISDEVELFIEIHDIDFDELFTKSNTSIKNQIPSTTQVTN